MKLLPTPTRLPAGYAVRPGRGHTGHGAEDARLHGRWLLLARGGWLTVALLTVALFLAGVPLRFAELRTLCAGDACGPQLTVEAARSLQEAGLSLDFYATYIMAHAIIFAATWWTLAAVLVWRKPTDRMALFAALVFVLFGAGLSGVMNALADSASTWGVSVKFVNNLGFVSFFIFLYLFPDGWFVPRWTRWLTVLWLVVTITDAFFPGSPIDPDTWGLGPGLFSGLLVSGLFAQVYRYRRVSGPVQRQQTKWVVFGVAAAFGSLVGTMLLLMLIPALDQPTSLAGMVLERASALVLLLIPLCIGFAILRHRLWDVDILINRTLVYGALTACVVGFYVLVVGAAGALFRMGDNLLISLVATGCVAALFQPLRERLQRAVNRLMFGERDEPYAVLSRLGRRLEGTLAPDTVLPTVVQTVREALRLPYAAIALTQDEAFTLVAASGTPPAAPLRLPLAYQHELVGELLVAPRAPGEAFSPADRRLLDDLARHAGVAVHAVRLTAELQRSREHLVTAREEERRRLRRDLHDGLGPALSSVLLKVGAARRLLPPDSAADDVLVEVRDDVRRVVADVRRLVYDLRPPALDQLGLALAIGEHAEACAAHSGLRVTIDAPDHLPPLPAAVEVAAYRIAQEALTNVVRHAHARTCTIRLALAARPAPTGQGQAHVAGHDPQPPVVSTSAFCLEVIDDGVGLPTPQAGTPRHAGVGLTAMRERAAELGGTCTVEAAPAGGTRVLAHLPLRRE